MSSPILVNFDPGGSPTSIYAHRTWEKKLGQRPIQISPGKKTSRQGSAEQSGLGAAALRKAAWWDLRLASLLTHLFVSLPCGIFSRPWWHSVYPTGCVFVWRLCIVARHPNGSSWFLAWGLRQRTATLYYTEMGCCTWKSFSRHYATVGHPSSCWAESSSIQKSAYCRLACCSELVECSRPLCRQKNSLTFTMTVSKRLGF